MEPVTAAMNRQEDGYEVVLALNSGSSSLKFGLYAVGPDSLVTLLSGESDGPEDPETALGRICHALANHAGPPPTVIGHRVVHGGPNLVAHCLIDPEVLKHLEVANAFAPLHGPPALALIRAAQKCFPRLPQFACLDTAFHATMPELASVLPIPSKFRSDGVRRYGFHGLSCESIIEQLAANVPDRMIIAHLGNGASVTATKTGRSIDTSMGLTPSGGIIMGSRSGDLDPGILLYLLREKGFDAKSLETLIDHESGLFGVSGISNDMRVLHRSARSSAAASLAIEMFCYSVRKQIAAMIAVLEGVDMIVFTGGIGENDEVVRATICQGLSWAGVREGASKRDNPRSPTRASCEPVVAVRTLPSKEDEQIARHSRALVTRAA